MKNKKVYVAGPLFNPYQKELHSQIIELCKKFDFKTFSCLRTKNIDGSESKKTFSSNLHNLEKSDFVIANLCKNGLNSSVTSDTAWEIGYAIARGKSIIGIKTDLAFPLTFSSWKFINPMIFESSFVVQSLDVLENALSNLKNN